MMIAKHERQAEHPNFGFDEAKSRGFPGGLAVKHLPAMQEMGF